MEEKSRFKYMDALRGLAMISVVMGHIYLFGFQSECDGITLVLTSLELPIFL